MPHGIPRPQLFGPARDLRNLGPAPRQTNAAAILFGPKTKFSVYLDSSSKFKKVEGKHKVLEQFETAGRELQAGA